MKKHILSAALILLGTLLPACGAEEGETPQESESTWIGMAPGDDLSAIAERTEYYDLTVQSEYLFDLGLWEQNPQEQNIQVTIAQGGTVYLPLATQFLEGEPVQLWTEASSTVSNVWLYKTDGSRELLLQDAPGEYSRYSSPISGYQWYMDRNGDFYCYRTTYSMVNGGEDTAEASIVKILSSGEILYENTLEPGLAINDLCQTSDGRIYLLLQNDQKDTFLLAELDSSAGTLIPGFQWTLPFERYYPGYLGTIGDSPAVVGYNIEDRNYSIVKVDVTDGSAIPVLFFAGTSYGWHYDLNLQDFQESEDGSTELLLTDSNRLNCLLDKLEMQDIEKIPIVVRGGYWVTTEFRQLVSQFNIQNDTYHVIVEDCVNLDDAEDFARLTSVQMNSGNGPDILFGNDLMQDYIVGMLDKGALEELNPYMEASGVLEEDYFPLAFSTWRQGEHIYGVLYQMGASASRQIVDKELLGSSDTPSIDALMDALLSRDEDGVYYKNWDSKKVLSYWLEGTESLFGMVDWENGSCDFNTPLFEKLLEAARRYGDDGRKNSETAIAEYGSLANVLAFNSREELEEAGKVIVGTQFDDGCYAAAIPHAVLAISANSSHKEGAWEFIRFLISEEVQSTAFDHRDTPVNRKAFEKWMSETITKLTQIEYINGTPVFKPQYYGEEVSEETKEEYRQALEAARPLPVRTTFIQEIILDEAEDYFNGYKSAEEVIEVINNRVQLYLDENH